MHVVVTCEITECGEVTYLCIIYSPESCASFVITAQHYSVADPGGVQIPALLFRCPFLKRTYFENMSLRFLAEQGAS